MTEAEQLQLFSDLAAPVCGWPEWYAGTTAWKLRPFDRLENMWMWRLPADATEWTTVTFSQPHEAIALCEHHMREWLEERVDFQFEIERSLGVCLWVRGDSDRDECWRGPYKTYFEALVAAVQAAGKEQEDG